MHFLVVTDVIVHTILLPFAFQVTAQVFLAHIFTTVTFESCSIVHLMSVK